MGSSLALLYSLLITFSFTLMLSAHLYLSTARRHLFRYISFATFALAAYLAPLLLIAASVLVIYFVETVGNFRETLHSLQGEHL